MLNKVINYFSDLHNIKVIFKIYITERIEYSVKEIFLNLNNESYLKSYNRKSTDCEIWYRT
jgi:hypothetical protein